MRSKEKKCRKDKYHGRITEDFVLLLCMKHQIFSKSDIQII